MLGAAELGDLYTTLSIEEQSHTHSVKNYARKNFSATTCTSNSLPKFNAKAIANAIVKSPNFFSGPYKHFQNESNPAEAIQVEWKRIGQQAIVMGIQLHSDIENYYKSKGEHKPAKIYNAFKQFLDFDVNVRQSRKWLPYSSELRIHDLDFPLCGTIDMLFATENGDLVMLDWKRSKQNFVESYNKFCSGPLCNIPATLLNKYSFQQNIYKYVFNKEKNLYAQKCNRKITEMYLLQMHDTLPEYKLWPVVEYGDEMIEKYLLYYADN